MLSKGLLILVLLLSTGCSQRSVLEKSPEAQPLPTPVEVVQEEASHPISLPIFSQKEFSGTDFALGQVLTKNEAYTRYYITYKSGDLKISGIMNVPGGTGPFPVLILNHGHIDTSVYTNGRGLKREQDYLARRGYVVVHPDFRNHAQSDKDSNAELTLRLGYTEDSINAILAVRGAQLDFIDAERIGMLGHSMGGGITMNVLVARPDLVDAAVLFAPVSSDYRENFERWTRRQSDTAERIIASYGTATSNPAFWRDISSRTFFDLIQAPILIHHGTADADVPLAWSQSTSAALMDAGKEVTLYTYDGEPHEFIDAWPQVMQRTVDFFDEYLKAS